MANRTVKDAHSVKGTNPQYLVEKIIRTRIYECRYWKEECFALTAALLVDKAMELKYIGGVYGGNVKPSPFLCLVLKMLQIQPEKDIVVEFLRNENFKYVRALGAFYMRLTGSSLDCYKYLEPLYYDYRKLKRQDKDGGFELIHMDEFIDELIREERVCDIILPRLQKRTVMEESNTLDPRVSALEEDLENMDTSDDEEAVHERSLSPERRRGSHKDVDKPNRSPSPRHARSPSPHSRSNRKRSRSRDRDKDRDKRRRSPEKSRRRDEDDDRRRKHKKHKHDHKDHKDRKESDRHHKHSDDSDRHHKHSDDRDRDRHKHRDRRDKRESGLSQKELEIKEANEQRAKLGLGPLK
ncbi:pre-mRNA-splicing factor 38A-like [Mizuhopecten yessoensis]|uniref:Pre-mRNA-splicing factor 38 n=1 Tax=Mizuhopecten yessoensis TaxID=6573 RepID=A0A210Q089_MIZYE|nr:pre-mRNA-splicing factor 38A-like [Mizuhopecten yessoensis]OWF42142.1 Pre-mRNA-splicing factor 38A [Mizuhopecten yessoensis]